MTRWMLPTVLGVCLIGACSTEETGASPAKTSEPQAKASNDATAPVRSDAPMKGVGVQTSLPADATCTALTWCGSRAAAKRIAVESLPHSLGCPATVGAEKLVPHADAPDYASFPDVPDALGFDVNATRTLRGSGDIETCCFVRDCGATKNADPRSAASGR